MVTKEEIVGIGIMNKIKENMKRIDSEKNTTTTVIDENVVMLSIEEKKCEHIIPTKGLLIL